MPQDNRKLILHNVSSLYSDPSSRSELVSQAIYGDVVAEHEVSGEFSRVVMQDGYEGWLRSQHIGNLPGGISRQAGDTAVICIPFADLLSEPEPDATLVSRLTIGSHVVVLSTVGVFAQTPFGYIPMPCLAGAPTPTDRQPMELLRTAQSLIGTPYLWGGTSAFGIDCSGFVQRIFGMYGVPLPRDAYQQAKCFAGQHISAGDTLFPGDIIFFQGREDPRGRGITHTGIVMDESEGTFIHAYGKLGVCISRLQDPEIQKEYRSAGCLRVIWKQISGKQQWIC